MSVLMANQKADFNMLKDVLELTDGNLASHLKALEKEEYIEVEKKFVARKPKTIYRASLKGKNAFQAHLTALEDLIKGL